MRTSIGHTHTFNAHFNRGEYFDGGTERDEGLRRSARMLLSTGQRIESAMIVLGLNLCTINIDMVR